MSGHCDFCGIWHSGSCCHPARQTVAALESRVDTWMLACRNAERARDEAIEQRDRAEAERDLAARAHKAAEIAHAQMRAEQDALMQIALMWHSHEYIKRTIDAALKEKP